MADPMEEAKPDSQPVAPAAQPPAETVPAGDKATIPPTEEAQPMEVHHHAHHGGKKSWKSYFWEFLMLFLAVFCGFLAENIREHQVERHREEEFMNSLYQDMRTDTTNISSLINTKLEEIANNDSLFDIFRNKTYLQETANAYYFGRKSLNSRVFYPTDGTIKQLENSGGFRLVKNRVVVDSIQSYLQTVSRLQSIQDIEAEHSMLARSQMGNIFDADVFDRMIGNSTSAYIRPDTNYPLMPFTPAQLNNFHVPMNFIKRNKYTQIALLKLLQSKASDLMKLLEEKYEVGGE